MKREKKVTATTEKSGNRSDKRKSKIWRVALIEIVFMSLGVMAVLLPLPYRVIALIVLGARGIIVRTIAETKKLPPKR